MRPKPPNWLLSQLNCASTDLVATKNTQNPTQTSTRNTFSGEGEKVEDSKPTQCPTIKSMVGLRPFCQGVPDSLMHQILRLIKHLTHTRWHPMASRSPHTYWWLRIHKNTRIFAWYSFDKAKRWPQDMCLNLNQSDQSIFWQALKNIFAFLGKKHREEQTRLSVVLPDVLKDRRDRSCIMYHDIVIFDAVWCFRGTGQRLRIMYPGQQSAPVLCIASPLLWKFNCITS